MSDDRFRALKAILRTAFAWGFVLGAISAPLIALYAFIVPGPEPVTLFERVVNALYAGVGLGVRFAVAGAILGTLFSTFLRFVFRGRRVAELHPGKFAVIGALVGGIGIPLVYQFLNIISGDGPVLWKYLFDDIPWAATVGALGAAGTVWMARRGAALPAEKDPAAVGEGDPVARVMKGWDRERVER